MIVGGMFEHLHPFDSVVVVSLDPDNHPVPECAKKVKPFPKKIMKAAAASLTERTCQNLLFAYV